MMRCTMFRSIQTCSVNGKFTERYHIFCARIDLFTIFVCSRYRPWLSYNQVTYHFGFIMCVSSRLYCRHFSCHWRKIRNVSRRLSQISKRQRDPWFLLPILFFKWCNFPFSPKIGLYVWMGLVLNSMALWLVGVTELYCSFMGVTDDKHSYAFIGWE